MGETIFIGTLGLFAGFVIGFIACLYFGIAAVRKVREGAIAGVKAGAEDVRKRDEVEARKKELLARAESLKNLTKSIATKVSTYFCEDCQRTFSLVAPPLDSTFCPTCGAIAIPASKVTKENVRVPEALEA